MAQCTLAISFYGPFGYIFEEKTVRIFAPQCDGHLASVQTDSEEKALDGRTPTSQATYEYRLVEASLQQPFIGVGSPSKTGCHNGKNILLVDTKRRRAPKPTLEECYFQIEVPRPNYVIGLIPDPISYLEYDQTDPGNGKTCMRAIAHRFHYDKIDNTRTFQVVRTGKPNVTIVEISMKPFKDENLVQASFRYRSDGMFQEDHHDAEECFQQMRNLFPPLGAWRVNFDQGPPLDKHGSDCRAAQIVFLTKSEMDQWQKSSAPEIKWRSLS
jgi:hypothetical protein